MSSGGGTNDIINHQNEQIQKQYEYDLQAYQYQYGLQRNENGDFVQIMDPDGTKAGVIPNQYEYAQQGLQLRKEADQETRDYQQETARQNWEQGKSMQQFTWDQEDSFYRKNIDQYNKQLDFNELEYADALSRENVVLDEKFIGAAFENQGLIQDLYEQTGTAGFAKTQSKLGLLSKENTAAYQKAKALTNLKQNAKGAEFQVGGEQLEILNRRGGTQYQQATIAQSLAEKEGNRRFQKAGILLDTKIQTQAADYQNEMIRRQFREKNAETAHRIEEQTIKGLQASGQAQLTQAGRSQGKAVQSIMAELGRNNAYLADSLVRGQQTAEARMKQNKINNLNVIQKAAQAEQQIDFSSLQDINKSLMAMSEADRNLKIGDAKSQLNMDEIRQSLVNNLENTTLDVENIEENLLQAQTETGVDLKKIDFDLANVGSRFKTNQDVLTTSLQSAVRASEMNKKDIYRSKKSADLAAEARKMLDPSVGRDLVDLDQFQPLEIPLPKYQDPMAPAVPPAPIKGATQSQVGAGASIAGAALSGVTAGIGAAVGVNSLASKSLMGLGAGPWGAIVGLGTFAMGLF